MTIEEKAKDYAGYNSPYPQGSLTTLVFAAVMRGDRCEGFKAGAEWILKKATQRFGKEVEEFESLLRFVNKKSAGLIDKEKTIENFRKAMEE